MLLHEFAVEPEMLDSWEKMRLFLALFGIPKGRMVSQYPRKWPQRVERAIRNGSAKEVEKLRCIEKLKLMKETFLYDRAYQWNDTLPWLENAVQEDTRNAFRAILASGFSTGNGRVIPWDDVADDHELIKVETGKKIDRSARIMAGCVSPLLRMSKEIVFVDRHFRPSATCAWLEPLRLFLESVIDRPNLDTVLRLEYHIALKENEPPGKYPKNFQDFISQVVPKGLSLNVHLVDWKPNHNRFILTDRGGFKFNWGLDECLGQRDNVGILSPTEWAEEWETFKQRPLLCTVEGTKS